MTVTALISELNDHLRQFGDMEVKYCWENYKDEPCVGDIEIDRERHPFGTASILSIRSDPRP